jgi:hypothetical protein
MVKKREQRIREEKRAYYKWKDEIRYEKRGGAKLVLLICQS